MDDDRPPTDFEVICTKMDSIMDAIGRLIGALYIVAFLLAFIAIFLVNNAP